MISIAKTFVCNSKFYSFISFSNITTNTKINKYAQESYMIFFMYCNSALFIKSSFAICRSSLKIHSSYLNFLQNIINIIKISIAISSTYCVHVQFIRNARHYFKFSCCFVWQINNILFLKCLILNSVLLNLIHLLRYDFP